MNMFQCFHLIVNISFQVDKKEKKQGIDTPMGWAPGEAGEASNSVERDVDRGHCLPVRSGRQCWLYEENRILYLQRGDCHSTLKTALTYIHCARVCVQSCFSCV